METRKRVERHWYDAAAARDEVTDRALDRPPSLGADSARPEFRAPYDDFERQVRALARPGAVVLDVGAGTGEFSVVAAGQGRALVATDISPVALRVARMRASANAVALHVVCADAERLPFRDRSVDLVSSAGVLYCLNMPVVIKELRRVLRDDGAWVIVDSLNDSPVYRFNRWIGYLRHRRTHLAVDNVPTTASFDALRAHFASVILHHHGVLTFLVPLLKPILGAKRAGAAVSAADQWLQWIRRWSFKVVVVARGTPAG